MHIFNRYYSTKGDSGVGQLLFSLVIFLVFVQNPGYSQDHGFQLPYNHYTTRDGLAQLQIRSLAGDAYGQIWIGTQNGLSMFDGRRFRSFGPSQGVPRSTFFQLAVDNQQRVWGMSRSELFVFDGVEGKKFPFPGTPHHGSFLLLPDGRLLVRHNGLKLFADGEFQELPSSLPKEIHDSENLLYYDLLTGDIGTIDVESRTVLHFNLNGDVRDLFTYGPDEQVSNALPCNSPIKMVIYSPASDRYLSLEGLDTVTVLEIKGDAGTAMVDQLQFNILRPDLCPKILLLDSNRGKGLWILNEGRYQRRENLAVSSISAAYQTSSGQVYLGTAKGLLQYHLNGWSNLEVPYCDLPWSVIPLANRDEVILGCHREGILSMTRDGILTGQNGFGKHQFEHEDQIFPGYTLPGDGRQVFGGFRGLYRRMPGGEVRYQPEVFTIEALKTDTTRSVLLAAGLDLLTYDLSGELLQRAPIPITLSQRVSCTDILVDRSGEYWVSCWGGIGHTDVKAVAWDLYTRQAGQLPFESVFSMIEDNRGRIWCGGSEGIAVRDLSTGKFRVVLPDLITEQVSQLLLAGRDTLIVIGSKDFYLLEISGSKPRLLVHLNDQLGYQVREPSENGAFLEASGVLWVAAASGIHRFDFSKYGLNPPERSHLLLDKINEQTINQSQKTQVRIDIRDPKLVIQYRVLSPLLDKVHLEYRFDSQEAWTRDGEEGTLMVNDVRHGHHTLFLRAVIPGWSEEAWPTAAVDIHCKLPLVEQKGAQQKALLLVILLIIWGLWSVWERVRSRRALTKLHKQLDESRLKAIQAQLNPHFIFNAMTSLQNTIRNKSPEEASNQLVRLSRLIRQVLEFSVKQAGADASLPLTPLEDELNLLGQYVALEQQQRDPGFHFHLDIDPELLEENPLVPPLLIQPFVENAIIHGLGPLERMGNIWVVITAKEETLYYTIEDDGIGRKASQAARSDAAFVHRSLGVTLLQERILTLRSLGYTCHLSIHDRIPSGTFVNLQLSLRYEDRNY